MPKPEENIGDMFEDVFLKEKLNTIPEIDEDDNILASLTPESTAAWKEITAISAEGTVKMHELMRLGKQLDTLKKRFESKHFLFWDVTIPKDERFETAEQRGRGLAVKQDETGGLVIVEYELPKSTLPGIMLIPPEGMGDR